MIAALLLALTVADSAHGSVVTDTLWSQSLGAKKAVVVYLPPSYKTSPARRYPVAYYLHGLWGSETNWTKQGELNVVMDSLVAAGGPEMIVVMPDGDDGWYTTWNSLVTADACRRALPADHEPAETYCVPWQHYDDYIARDVVQFTDKKYRTQAARANRAIAGLSMGGYGTMSLALEYSDVFGAAASHSGVLSPLYMGPRPFDGNPQWARDGAELELAYGKRFWPAIAPAFGRDTSAWWSRDPGRRLEKLIAAKGKSAVPALFADCGTEDDLVNQNRVFKWRVEQLGLSIVYHEWPGKHEWPYWRAHVGESLHWIGTQIGNKIDHEMTAEFFPRKTVAWKLEEPAPLRQLSLSLPYMALITGVMLRLWRSYVLTHGAPDSWAWVGGTFLIGMAFLFLMVAIHLGNYTLRNWTWRAPAFALLESGTEILMSLALTTFGLEPLGADRAELSDWLPESVRTLIVRLVGILLFVMVLAVVVSIMRRILLVAEQRSSMAVRIKRASQEQESIVDADDTNQEKGPGA